MKRSFSFILIGLFSLVCFTPSSWACGVVTHGDISQRAAWVFADPDYPQYAQWLAAHNGALLAGAGFPDWGWLVGFTPEAEAAHSASMAEAAADYVRETYPQPWDEETQRTAIFLLGFLSHIVADTQFTTHGGKSYEEGFLGVMGELEFPGRFDFAHHYGDIAGEAFIVHQNEFDYFESWYVPTQDMAQIYQNLGYERVTPEIIELSMNLMYVGSLAIKTLAASANDLFALLTVFAPEQYQDFFAGGLDDMGTACAWRWPGLIEHLETAAAKPLALNGGASTKYDEGRQLAAWAAIGQGMIERGEIALTKEVTERGVIFHASLVDELKPAKAVSREVEGLDRTLTFITDTPYSYLGSSLAAGDFNNDGLDDLAMGSPGFGGPGEPQIGLVQVQYAGAAIESRETIDLSATPADIELMGVDPAGRFGWDLAVVDLNRDGRDDLAISAPSFGAVDWSYYGKVLVYYGTVEGLATEPGLVIESSKHRHNFGYSLASGDVDGDGFADLLVGSPFADVKGYQHGSVAIFLGSQNLKDTISPDDAFWRQSGDNAYDWFGYRLAVVDLGAAGRFLLVGAPKFRVDTMASAGRLYGYALPDLTPAFTVTGVNSFDQTGAEFAVAAPYGDDKPYLLLASPTQSVDKARQGGAVWLLDPDDLTGDLALDDLSPVAVFRNDQPGARLGWRIGVADANSDGVHDIWLTEPYRETDAGLEAGAAQLFLGGNWFPTGEINGAANADWSLPYESAQSWFGSEISFLDYNDDGVTDTVFGARHATDEARTAGRVMVALSPLPVLAALAPQTAEVGTSPVLTLTGERLLDAEISIQLVRGENVLTAEQITLLDTDRLDFTLAIPADAETGAYDLLFANRFGEAELASALTIEPGSVPDDDDDNNDNDDTTDDDTTDDDDDNNDNDDNDDSSPAPVDDDDDNDDSGCGC